jgi:hypothetical protein
MHAKKKISVYKIFRKYRLKTIYSGINFVRGVGRESVLSPLSRSISSNVKYLLLLTEHETLNLAGSWEVTAFPLHFLAAFNPRFQTTVNVSLVLKDSNKSRRLKIAIEQQLILVTGIFRY